jgi:hypothetical protein
MRKSTFNNPDQLSDQPLSPSPTHTLSANISDHARSHQIDPTHAQPRPPQTRAASLKRLYPK